MSPAGRTPCEKIRLQQARIAVAIAAGDADELIAVKRDDLHSPFDPLEIAQLLAETGRIEEAIEWARRGLEPYTYRWHQTPKLRDPLAGFLIGRALPDEVADLDWDAFVRRPTLGTYRQFIDDDTRPAQASAAAIDHPQGRPHALIEALDPEGRHDELRTLYLEYACEHDLAMRLAKHREADHSLDASAVYLRDVERHIARKNRMATAPPSAPVPDPDAC